jgi:uncharacterized delta-60 repeat protein
MQHRFSFLSRGLPLLASIVAVGAAVGACTGSDPEPCTGSSCTTAAAPDGGGPVATAAFEITGAASITLVQGATVDVDVTVTRAAFDGPITASVNGLPAGVIPSPLVIQAGATTAKLTLSALATAAQGTSPITLAASSADGAIHRERTATLLVRGAAGAADTTFATAGKLITNVGTNGIAVKSAVVQADGRILVGGQSDNDFIALRLGEAGALDPSYGTNGAITIDLRVQGGMASVDSAGGMALTPSGQAVLGGYRSNMSDNTYGLARLTATGALDPTFDTDGYATPGFVPAGANSQTAFGVAVQPDGRILLAGSVLRDPVKPTEAIIARFKTNGALDDTFGNDTSGFFYGRSQTSSNDSCETVAVDRDGKILAACAGDDGGNHPVALRLLPNGQPDTAFGPGATGYSPIALFGGYAHDIHELADRRLLLTGATADGRLFVVRLQSNGTLDTSFGVNGTVFVVLPMPVTGGRSVLDAAERLVFSGGLGANGDLVVVRVDGAGKLDTTFAGSGYVATAAGAKAVADNARVAIAPDGRVVAPTNLEAMPLQLVVARFWP